MLKYRTIAIGGKVNYEYLRNEVAGRLEKNKASHVSGVMP
jgi:hypothetical protein